MNNVQLSKNAVIFFHFPENHSVVSIIVYTFYPKQVCLKSGNEANEKRKIR